MIIGMVMIIVTLVLIGAHEASIRLFHRSELVPARVRATSAGVAAATLAVLIVAAGEDGGWVIFMTVVLSLITLATLAGLRTVAALHAATGSHRLTQAS